MPVERLTPMRVILLQTIGGFGPDGEAGGGVVQFVRLCAEWKRLGHEIHYVTNSADHGLTKYPPVAIPHLLPVFGRADIRSPLGFVTQVIGNHLKQRMPLSALGAELSADPQPTIVVATSPALSDVLAAGQLARRLKTVGIVCFHHMTPPFWWFGRRRGTVGRNMAIHFLAELELGVTKVSGLVLALDQPRAAVDSGWKFPDPILATPCATPDGYVGAPDSASPGDRTNDACYIGRVAQNKGIFDLIHAWSLVAAQRTDANLIIAGVCHPPQLATKVRRVIRRLELEGRVHLVGFISEDAKKQLLARTRLFVFPSYEEGWSLAVMEAAAFGALPVTYDLVAYDYLGPAAQKVSVGRYDELARRILVLMHDEPARLRAAEQLRGEINRQTIQQVAAAEMQSFLDLISATGPRSLPPS
jgi:glycosyltransferase involved in cell wall biosynthesis